MYICAMPICRRTRSSLSPAVVLTVGALMTLASVFYSPETKDLTLSEIGDEESNKKDSARVRPHNPLLNISNDDTAVPCGELRRRRA
jgi:hypothetical protein